MHRLLGAVAVLLGLGLLLGCSIGTALRQLVDPGIHTAIDDLADNLPDHHVDDTFHTTDLVTLIQTRYGPLTFCFHNDTAEMRQSQVTELLALVIDQIIITIVAHGHFRVIFKHIARIALTKHLGLATFGWAAFQ